MSVTTRQELEQHLVRCPDCLADLDAGGNIVPEILCRKGRYLHLAYTWDQVHEDGVLAAMEADLASGRAQA